MWTIFPVPARNNSAKAKHPKQSDDNQRGKSPKSQTKIRAVLPRTELPDHHSPGRHTSLSPCPYPGEKLVSYSNRQSGATVHPASYSNAAWFPAELPPYAPTSYRIHPRPVCPAEKNSRLRKENPWQRSVPDDNPPSCRYAADIHRTFPEDKSFTEEKIQSLKNILIAYSRRNCTLGYCQGFNYIVGKLLKVIKDEENVFWIFVQILENILPINY